jgi:uncharacterized protein (DUF1778 family)
MYSPRLMRICLEHALYNILYILCTVHTLHIPCFPCLSDVKVASSASVQPMSDFMVNQVYNCSDQTTIHIFCKTRVNSREHATKRVFILLDETSGPRDGTEESAAKRQRTSRKSSNSQIARSATSSTRSSRSDATALPATSSTRSGPSENA